MRWAKLITIDADPRNWGDGRLAEQQSRAANVSCGSFASAWPCSCYFRFHPKSGPPAFMRTVQPPLLRPLARSDFQRPNLKGDLFLIFRILLDPGAKSPA